MTDVHLTPRTALELWFSTLKASLASGGHDLSSRQMAVLMTVYLGTPPHTVRSLSEALAVPRPAVTRSLDTLERLDLVRRKPDPDDRRVVMIQRTVKGSVFLTEFGHQMVRAAERMKGHMKGHHSP